MTASNRLQNCLVKSCRSVSPPTIIGQLGHLQQSLHHEAKCCYSAWQEGKESVCLEGGAMLLLFHGLYCARHRAN